MSILVIVAGGVAVILNQILPQEDAVETQNEQNDVSPEIDTVDVEASGNSKEKD